LTQAECFKGGKGVGEVEEETFGVDAGGGEGVLAEQGISGHGVEGEAELVEGK
jgi:hypothetical protein